MPLPRRKISSNRAKYFINKIMEKKKKEKELVGFMIA